MVGLRTRLDVGPMTEFDPPKCPLIAVGNANLAGVY